MENRENDQVLSEDAIRRKLEFMSLHKVAKQTGLSMGTLKRIKYEWGGMRMSTARKLTDFFNRM